jgi:hypothetical protein
MKKYYKQEQDGCRAFFWIDKEEYSAGGFVYDSASGKATDIHLLPYPRPTFGMVSDWLNDDLTTEITGQQFSSISSVLS